MPANNYEEQQQDTPNLAFHPFNVLLMLSLVSLGALFLTLTAAFMYARIQNQMPPIKLPNLFIVNTLILLGSSGAMFWAKRAYLKDDTQQYQYALITTIVLSLLFMVSQFIAWKQMFSNNIFIDSSLSASYLYVISGLHFAHVIGGLPFLGVFLWKAYKHIRNL